jgi:ribosomal protein S18 acetylase RimI-like enzyme
MRRAEPSDLAAVVELTERAYAPYTAAFNGPPIPVTENYGPRIAAGEVWLLEDGGRLIGLIVLEDNDESLSIFSVAVAPERHGEGLGRRLLSFAEDQGRKRGAFALTLYTNARMTRNLGIYRRFGFVETGRRPNPQREGWTIVDMEKSIAPYRGQRTVA